MQNIDFIVMIVFALLIMAMGLAFTKSGSTDTKSFFAAGGQAPWWISGLSLFMSYFSAGTFVVWGSIAYKSGWVAVTIQLMMCLGGLLTALFIAPRWKKTGAITAAEFIGKRLGTKVQQFYTYLILFINLFSTGAFLYPVGKIVYLATPFSLEACIIGLGIMVILYTAAGGLWAVLVTDVMQFVILTAAVIIVIPLSFAQVGGITEFVDKTPNGFFSLFTSEYTPAFMVAFVIYQTVFIGGNWAYVQRYTSVADEKAAKKVGYLFAGLYSICPIIWMLPPMIYRTINPDLKGLEAEGAYLLICQQVMPAGLMGLMLAGMIAATASSVNTTLNLVAAVFTNDIYKNLIRPYATDHTLMLVARSATVVFGLITIIIALLVPSIGGVVEVVLTIASLTGGALYAPILWALCSKRQTAASVFTATLVTLNVGIFFKFISPILFNIRLDRIQETLLGSLLPLMILAMYEIWAWSQNKISFQYELFKESRKIKQDNSLFETQQDLSNKQNAYGIRVIAASMAVTGSGILMLSFIAKNSELITATVAIIVLASSYPLWHISTMRNKNQIDTVKPFTKV
ncbi:sodium:solute symporter family protein [Rhodocytophaga aerolata]|uniref:Sodium:solute symporter family protein n=1 Tax=Rhodocytophaga aerolata TaxID=455078 RepID=A0ABT8RDH6_9BACT|nr:sodium:solute symporter family protein [Rhodocytophaga aerolata]MDO1449394.1 sodium:solute symporter family protein [Rhodocytophaga aerolata]